MDPINNVNEGSKPNPPIGDKKAYRLNKSRYSPVTFMTKEAKDARLAQNAANKAHDTKVEAACDDAIQALPRYIDGNGFAVIANSFRDTQVVSGKRTTPEGGVQKTKAAFSKEAAYYAANYDSDFGYALRSDEIDNSKVAGYNSKCEAMKTKKLKGQPTVSEDGVKTYPNGAMVATNEEGYEVTSFSDGSEKYARTFKSGEVVSIDGVQFEAAGLTLTAFYDEQGNMVRRVIK